MLIGAIARALGVKYGKSQMPQHVRDTETLFQHMKVNPAHLQKWEPKTQTVTFGNS